MQNRGFNEFCRIRAICHRAFITKIRSRETDLIVDHDVHRAAGTVAAGIGKVQRLHDDALTCKGSVAVNKNAHHAATFRIMAAILSGANASDCDRVDNFQVRRIKG